MKILNNSVYNKDMEIKIDSNAENADEVRLIRVAGFLCIGYVAALAAINMLIGSRPPVPPNMPNESTVYDIIYYILNALIALLCINMGYWYWIQKKLGKAFVPTVIGIMTVLPIVINWLMIGPFPLGSRFTPDNPIWRQFPFLFIGILLVAWRYKWSHLLAVILGITALSFGSMWSTLGPGGSGFQGNVSNTLIQTFIFLAVGFSINFLMNRLKKQHESLVAANINLTHYASTLDQLSASRERNRLARELHDTLAHTLSGLSVQMETIKAYWDVDPPTARSLFEKSLAAAHSGLEETRRALKSLRATPLDDLGLALAISNYARDMTVRSNLQLEMNVSDKLPVMSPDVEQCIYRIAQEAITNVIHHASAKKLTLTLENLNKTVLLTVTDDGTGFEIEKSDQMNHFGLKGMKERTDLVGGQLQVTSKPGFGTTIRLTVHEE